MGAVTEVSKVKQRFGATIQTIELLKERNVLSAFTDWRYYSYKNNRNELVKRLKYTDTSNGVYFNSMLEDCGELEYVPDLDTSKGETFSKMFYAMHNLLKSPKIDTSNGKDFYAMYNCCCKMKEAPQLETKNGENFSYMYLNCQVMDGELTADVSNGKNFEGFLNNAYKIKAVALDNMDLEKAENTKMMFDGCHEVELIAGAVMGKTGAKHMFRACGKAQSILGFKINPYLTNSSDVWLSTFEWCYELVTLEIDGVNYWGGLDLSPCKKLSKYSIIRVMDCLAPNGKQQFINLSKTAVNKAFETSAGANDGAASAEWDALIKEHSTWDIRLQN